MDLGQLITICKKYNDLGWAVQEQLGGLIEGKPAREMNGNAVRMIEDWLSLVSRETETNPFTSADLTDLAYDIDELWDHIKDAEGCGDEDKEEVECVTCGGWGDKAV